VFEVHKTSVFLKWANKIDPITRAKVYARIRRLELGNFGDVKPVGRGVSELRIHSGAGYRVYFIKRDNIIIVLLCGGDKGSQEKDINTAKSLADSYSD